MNLTNPQMVKNKSKGADIVRSKSKKRAQNAKVKFDASPKTERVNKGLESKGRKSKTYLVGVDLRQPISPKEMLGRPFILSNETKHKPSRKFVLNLVPKEPVSGSKRSTRNEVSKMSEEGEVQRQENTIQYLYDTIKHTVGPLFDKFNWNCTDDAVKAAAKERESQAETGPSEANVQERYEFTLREISEIWRNTISLIRSVKDHTLEFVDKKNPSFDREQLALEAEMVQLAVDFAINFSKLKTDFFIQWLSKRLNVDAPEKTELENFIDSKTFSSFYNGDDLDTMARTVEDLNASVLKGEDFGFE